MKSWAGCALREGLWDEWLVLLNGQEEAWLQEDEGELTLFRKAQISGQTPAFDTIKVSQTVTLQLHPPEKRQSG